MIMGGLFVFALIIFFNMPETLSQENTGVGLSKDTISQIIVQGNQRIETETVLSYMQFRVGQRYNATLIDKSLKALFATGLFADINIIRQGDSLIVQITESPIINRVAFEGNVAVDDSTLESEVLLKPRSIFSRAKVQDDVQSLLTHYRRSGRFAAIIDPKIIQLPQNRVDLVFEITEGPITKVGAINFVGNKVFSDSELRSEIATSESAWWKFFSASDNYDPDRLAFDRELLRRFYLNNGYADFRVISAVAELTPSGEFFFITFTVEEGEVYTFGEVSFESNIEGYNLEHLYEQVSFQTGELYDAAKLEETINTLTYSAGVEGYAFAVVTPRVSRDEKNRIINVVFELDKGRRIYVERININGNTRTLDRVIRRQLRFAEGDAFSRVLSSNSQRNIRSLGYFSAVELSEEPGTAEDQTIVDISVQEQSTGRLSFGVGVSSADDFIFDTSLSERNFLGRGQIVSLGLNYGRRRQTLDFQFTEPYFLDRNLSFGSNVYITEIDSDSGTSSYDQRSLGGGFTLGFPLTEHSRLSLNTSYINSRIFNVASNASLAVQNATGSTDRLVLGYSYILDKRDDPILPTSGWAFSWNQSYAGFLSSIDYLRQDFVFRQYYEVSEGWIASLRLTGGYIDSLTGEPIRINDSFFRGGVTFRGFRRSGGVGPRDSFSDDAVGAKLYNINTIDVSIPLPLPEEFGFNGSVFVDFGWVGKSDAESVLNQQEIRDDLKFRASAGTSFFWESPIGPVRFDIAEAFIKEDYDRTRLFRFSAGTQF
ncbi:MAG: outer membrane protein assembly factor BamA [Parvularculales bacterium]